MRTTDITESSGPKVVALALPAETSKRGLSVDAKVHLTVGPVKGDKAVADARDRIVREAVLAVRKYSAPKAGHRRIEKVGRPKGREQKEQKNDDLLHRRQLVYVYTCALNIWAFAFFKSDMTGQKD